MARDTRQRILDRARSLFNARGLHDVSVREIARSLEMSPGNLSYHFETKADLVTALVKELHELQSEAGADTDSEPSFLGAYRVTRRILENHLAYRFVFMSYPEVVARTPELRELEASLERPRRERFFGFTARLVEAGQLDRKVVGAAGERLYLMSRMYRFWLPASLLSHPDATDEDRVLTYAKLTLAVLEPACTPKGRNQLRRILKGQYD